MIFYYSLFLYLSVVSISQIYNKNNIYLHITNITSFLIITIFTGLRDNVGGDWNVYIVLFDQFKQFGFPSVQIFTSSDPMYITVNILADRIDQNIYLVNLIISFLLFSSIFFYFENNENKIITILSSFLLIVIILAMGYSRQALAVAFLIFFYKFFIKENYILMTLSFIMAILSHKTTIIVFLAIIGTYIITNKKFLNLKFFFIFFISTLIFIYVYQVDLLRLIKVYFGFTDLKLSKNVEQELFSPGVLFKMLYILIFISMYFLFINKKFFKNKNELIVYNSLISLVIILLPFLGYLSSLVDRIIVFCYILVPLIVNKLFNSEILLKKKNKFFFQIFVIILSLSSVYLWFEFANHSLFWKEYNNIILN